MNKFRPKNMIKCKVCGEMFLPTNPRNTMCSDACRNAYYKSKGLNKTYHNGVYIPSGYHQSKENNNNWKGGTTYRHLVTIESCEICGSTENLLVHHIDHNRKNNVASNLMVLCKRCHQNHHCVRGTDGRYISHKV